MSKIRDEEKNAMDLGRKVEAQPLHALPMPPYGALSITNTDLSLRAENERLRNMVDGYGKLDAEYALAERRATTAEAKLEEAAKVLEPFADAVFNDNGDITVNFGAPGPDDFFRAYRFIANLKGAE